MRAGVRSEAHLGGSCNQGSPISCMFWICHYTCASPPERESYFLWLFCPVHYFLLANQSKLSLVPSWNGWRQKFFFDQTPLNGCRRIQTKPCVVVKWLQEDPATSCNQFLSLFFIVAFRGLHFIWPNPINPISLSLSLIGAAATISQTLLFLILSLLNLPHIHLNILIFIHSFYSCAVSYLPYIQSLVTLFCFFCAGFTKVIWAIC